ncbi:MAG TPA: GNAT family N-acetyltransferase [Candidatus Limnocylindrales bacterium]|nr:GNAT family N-acetyltransferase [Candidatus Limnocylindrales bacterium]
MQNIILDLALAREIELAEGKAAVGCAEMMKTLQLNTVAAVEAIAGGYAIYCGAGNPVTQAVGLGLNGPVSREAFDQLEAFYFSRKEPVRVETCPLADLSLMEHYKERGYHVSEFSNVMVRPVLGDVIPTTPPGIEIRRVRRDEVDLWVMTVSQGFADNYPITQELLNVMKMFALGQHTELYLASINGRVAGGATLAIRGRIAGLFGASTLPEFRKRGVQTALLYMRLQRSADEGCELAMSIAQPGSISQRNITRLGFQTLYTRVKFERACPATSTGS